MSNEQRKITNFTDLNAWKEAHRLYVEIYNVTKSFPKEEVFGLTNQIRRAALSVTSNLAEGFGRSSDNDKSHFYVVARGSLFEVQNQVITARDVGLLQTDVSVQLLHLTNTVQRILIGLINATKRRNKS